MIDDDPHSCEVLSNLILSEFNAEITTTHSGEEALLAILSSPSPFDIVFLDILMPTMNGIETCIRIREQNQYENVPIFFVSASPERDDLLNSFYAGGTDFIRKPVNKIELQARTRLALKCKKERAVLLNTIKEQGELIGKMSRYLEQMSDRLPFDPHTNLFSRIHMVNLIEQEWHRHKRSQLPLSLLMIRTEGITSEQQKAVAHTLATTCRRAADHVGIWDNNTFVVLVADSKEEVAKKLSELIQKNLKSFSHAQTFIGASSSTPPDNTGQCKDLVEAAQMALFAAKKKGPGSIEFKSVIFSSAASA